MGPANSGLWLSFFRLKFHHDHNQNARTRNDAHAHADSCLDRALQHDPRCLCLPVLTATLAMLFLDRFAGMHFFTSDFGGNMMMYVNLIWTWGHPEVYILILPAFGVYSEVVATFSRKRLFGYTSMVYAIWAIVILSFSVWLHHFFTMGAGADVNGFFGITTMLIAVPTGVKVFNWLFTMYRGRI